MDTHLLHAIKTLFEVTKITDTEEQIKILVHNIPKMIYYQQVSDMIHVQEIEYDVFYDSPNQVKEVPEPITNVVTFNHWTLNQRNLLSVIIRVFELTDWKHDLGTLGTNAGIAFIAGDKGVFYHKLEHTDVPSLNVLVFNLDRFDLDQWIKNGDSAVSLTYDKAINRVLCGLNLK